MQTLRTDSEAEVQRSRPATSVPCLFDSSRLIASTTTNSKTGARYLTTSFQSLFFDNYWSRRLRESFPPTVSS
jgi:hypothetical protein